MAALPPAPDARRLSLTWIHAGPGCLVVDKPSGLLSVPGRGEDKQDCALHRVQAQHPEALLVHRLDMATSGLLVFARSPAMQRLLSDAFATRRVEKRYVAVVGGHVAPAEQTIDLPLRTDWPNRPRQMVCPEHGKPSQTGLRVLSHERLSVASGQALDVSRVELTPYTGRSHQLRVHCQALDHPILGDVLYATPELIAAAPRLMLHARDLGLPALGDEPALTLHSPAPF